MSFHTDPQPDACRAWMPFPEPRPPGPPSVPLVCHMPKGHDGEHSNERRPSTLSRRWDGDARPPQPEASARPSKPTEGQRQAAHRLWNEILCNGGVPGWTPLDAIATELAEADARGHARGVAEAARLSQEMRGDGPCMDCGTLDTPVWFTDNVFWNEVVGGPGTAYDPGGLLCPICFIRRAETVMSPTGWRLTPEWPIRRRALGGDA